MEKSNDEICKILKLMDLNVSAYRGETGPMEKQENTFETVNFLIDEALKVDINSLYILCLGALTNVAVALKNVQR